MLDGAAPTKAAIASSNLQPIAESGDTDVLEAGVRQPREQIRVDLVVSELLLILAEAETAKPSAHIHGRAPYWYRIIAQSHRSV